MFKKIIASIFLTVFIFGTTFTASAASENYVRVDVPGGQQEHRLSREMYYAVDEYSAATYSLEDNFEGITDIYSAKESGILLLCGDTSKLFRISLDYSTAERINVVDKDGAPIDFKGALNVYSDTLGNIYISDTLNSRVLILDSNGVLFHTIETPVADILPKDFFFQPTTVGKDQYGYTYILSLGCYYGALTYTPDYEFMGFYGPNTVESSALDTLTFIWDKLTSTEEKRNLSVKKLPFSFTDFCFDNQGYMVTCTSNTSNSRYEANTTVGQIRKISHNGANILYKRNLRGETEVSTSVNFLENDVLYGVASQSIECVDISSDDYIFALEPGFGRIYIYDSECNLMSAFGGGAGAGTQLGEFLTPVSLTLNGNDVLVADSDSYSFTVFKPTEYGNLIREAQSLYLRGDYDKATEAWQKVLADNRNCQLAYRGLAMIHYNNGEYKEALEAAEIACDYSVYDLVWNDIVTKFVADNFAIIAAIVLIIAVAIFLLSRYLRKNNKVLIKNNKLRLLFEAPFHPFASFDDLKYKKMGSWKIAIVLTVLFYIASVLNVISTGFLFSNTLLRNYNSLYTLGATIGLVILWSVCNWLVCSMFEGKGSFSDVYISTTYCLAPWILFLFLKVILSNFIPLATAGLVSGIETAILIYTFFMLAIAMIKVHEFDFFKFLLTSIVVIFFMILVIFIILMCGILIAQFVSFISSIYEEIAHR